MSSDKTFHVVVFGLSEHELRVLRTICILSKSRSRTYVLDSDVASSTADFAIVDKDDPQALTDWHDFQNSHPMVSPVMVGNTLTSELVKFHIGRPIMATRLLAVLDQMRVSKERPAFTPSQADISEPAKPTEIPVTRQSLVVSSAAEFRALVVDDSLPIRKQMELELERYVGQVDLVDNGKLGIWLVAAKHYDIVFLDVVLPGVDGYQICRTIRRNKKTKDTPVIMLTGKSSPLDRVKGKLAGCDAYLIKPVDHAKFDKIVQTYLQHGGQGPLKRNNIPPWRAIPWRV